MARGAGRSGWNLEVVWLTLAAFATHFWRLGQPNAVVFDEMFGDTFSGHYLSGTWYYDVHPPLARMLVAACARIAGIPAADLLAGEPEPALRVLPALLGALLVPLCYALLRNLGGSRRVATLGGLFVLADNALLVESRYDLPDPFLLFFGIAALTAFSAARRRERAPRLAWLALSVALAGCAFSVKWTGASALGIIYVAWFWEWLQRPRSVRRLLIEGAVLITVPAAVYLATFAVHFRLLPSSGGSSDRVMPPAFQATLVGDPRYDPRASVPFGAKLIDLHRAMMRGNATLRGVQHAGSSPWYTWPIMKHPIGYWSVDPSVPREPIVILLGNPLVWWGGLVATIAAIVAVARRRRQLGEQTYAFWFLLGGYLLNFLPFAAITRVMYLYHYLFALVLLALTAALSCGILAGWNGNDDAAFVFESRRSAAAYWMICAAVVLCFIYFAPFSYGLPLSAESYDFHFRVLHPRF